MSDKKRRSKFTATSEDRDDGSFEILIGGEEPQKSAAQSATKGHTTSGLSQKWVALTAALVLTVIAAVSLAVLNDGAEDQQDSAPLFDETPGFRPYRGEAAPAQAAQERDVKNEEPRRPTQKAEVPKDEDEQYDRASDWRIGEHDVIGLEPDGERIVSDSRGISMSRREAQIRAERELEAIENSPTEFERRLHRRDAVLNSRVIAPSRGQIRVVPGVKVSQDIQQRLMRATPTRVREGLSDENFIGDESKAYAEHGDDFDEDYFDDFDDEGYDDEEDWDDDYR